MKEILDEIIAECGRQDEQWGGPSHADQHTRLEWFKYIEKYMPFWSAIEPDKDTFRQNMIKIAALAIAGIEADDRKEAAQIIRYPNYRFDGGKTPPEELQVCDNCREGSWFVPGYGGPIRICNNCKKQMRPVTPEEKGEALQFLKENGGNRENRQKCWGKETTDA